MEKINRKNIISTLILLILIVGIPLGLQIIKKETILRSKAVPGGVTFSGPNVTTRNNKTVLKLDAEGNAKLDLTITAPNAPGTQVTTTPGPTSAITPTPTGGAGPTLTPSPTVVSSSPTPTPSPSPSPRP